MDYLTALDAVISRGVEAAKRDYKDSPKKRDGAVAGFEACRNKTPQELEELRVKAEQATNEARRKANEGEMPAQDFWTIRCYEAEIVWVCNCVSVMLMNQGGTSPFPRHVGPTSRAAMTVAGIVGVRAPD